MQHLFADSSLPICGDLRLSSPSCHPNQPRPNHSTRILKQTEYRGGDGRPGKVQTPPAGYHIVGGDLSEYEEAPPSHKHTRTRRTMAPTGPSEFSQNRKPLDTSIRATGG